MKKPALVVTTALTLAGVALTIPFGGVAQARPGAQTVAASSGRTVSAGELDGLLAPIALYPDQLLAQMLMCATDPAGVAALDQFLKSRPTLKGTELQDAALKDNFQPSFVALALFPQIVNDMARQADSTTRLGQAFTADRSAVFASIQRLRAQAREAGNLKTTEQQEVQTQTTSSGEQVIVIEPSNPQIVYVPQYNAQTVYVQPSTVVVQNNSADAAVAGLIGFTAGVAIGAAVNNNYYYGPYGWHGGAYMYNDAWDDYYDHREDAREDWADHREDLADERGDRAGNQQEQRTERTEARQDTRAGSQEQRTERTQARQENRPQTQGTAAQTASTARSSGSYESRGRSQTQTATQDRSGTRSDAFSGYSSGKSERAASTRGQSSRSSSRSGSRSGGGGRRR